MRIFIVHSASRTLKSALAETTVVVVSSLGVRIRVKGQTESSYFFAGSEMEEYRRLSTRPVFFHGSGLKRDPAAKRTRMSSSGSLCESR